MVHGPEVTASETVVHGPAVTASETVVHGPAVTACVTVHGASARFSSASSDSCACLSVGQCMMVSWHSLD